MSHLMLLPVLSCPASCSYCFGPNSSTPGAGAARMSRSVLDGIADWLASKPRDEDVEITFHGGEPLAAGLSFYRTALPLLAGSRPKGKISFAVQSNLWLLSDELCDLFRDYHLSLGTSLDGPEEINDTQRGKGYFRKTMAGIDRARRAGLKAGCIATLTAQSVGRWRETLEFFRSEGLNVSFHAALPVLGMPRQEFELSPAAFGEALVALFDDVVAHAGNPGAPDIRVEPIDSILKGIHHGSGGMCVFGDCLGKHLAVGPDGRVYPCQRFVGLDGFELGNLGAQEGNRDFEQSAAWRSFARRSAQVETDCGGCEFYSLCRGGCSYNALASREGQANRLTKDPYCRSYYRILAEVVERATSEFFSSENMEDVLEFPDENLGLLRQGKILRMMRR